MRPDPTFPGEIRDDPRRSVPTLADELRAAARRYRIMDEAGEGSAYCPTERTLEIMENAAAALEEKDAALRDIEARMPTEHGLQWVGLRARAALRAGEGR